MLGMLLWLLLIFGIISIFFVCLLVYQGVEVESSSKTTL